MRSWFPSHPRVKPVVIGFEDISDSTLRLLGKFRNISIIDTPVMEETAESENTFYEAVERTLEAFPKYNIKIILGERNSQVGTKPVFQIFRSGSF